ncbi:MAG: glycoside hydrolase family 31 protein, partial [Nibricoccus sp.]
ARVTFDGASFMRPLALEFPSDTATHPIDDQFIVGSSLLVCPVTHPMYYARESRPLENIAKSRPVYLPADTLWYDFWTEKIHTGGHHHEAAAPLDTLPLFVRAGTILPLGPVLQHVDEHQDFPYELRIYSGASGTFRLYEDAGDTYDYERGLCAEVEITWNDQTRVLTFGLRQGVFLELVEVREFNIAFIGPHDRETRSIRYTGAPLTIPF